MTRAGTTVAVLLVVLLASASACSGARDSSEVAPNEAGAGDGRPYTGADSGEVAPNEAGAGDGGYADATGGPYTGAISASVGVPGASPSIPGYGVQAGFSAFAPSVVFDFGITTPTTGCSCSHGIGIGDPGPEEVSAGTITITAADGGPVLAALTPSDSGLFAYGYTSASGWAPGELLTVSAQGQPGQVSAFSTTLQTAAPFSDVTPAIGTAPVTILRSADFSVSWTPQAEPNEFVTLSITQTSTSAAAQCTCSGPESLGAITLPASSLADYFAPSSSGSSSAVSGTAVTLSRSVVSTFLTETSTVYLIGSASLSGSATFQ